MSSQFDNLGYGPQVPQPGPASRYDTPVPNYPALPGYQGERLRGITRAYAQNAAHDAFAYRGPEGLIDEPTYDLYSVQLFAAPVWGGPPDNSIVSTHGYDR